MGLRIKGMYFSDFTHRADSLHTSGLATIVFWQIGVLETIVYNLNPIADFAYINIVIVKLFILAAARQLRIGLYLITSLTLKMALGKLYIPLSTQKYATYCGFMQLSCCGGYGH